MPDWDSNLFPLWAARTLTALFFAICFLQSALDKIVDRAGNLEYFRGHFANSPLRGMAVRLLWPLAALELAAGLFSALGFFQLVFAGSPRLALIGMLLSALCFTALFLGQRLAKDYPGATGLVPYFFLSVAAVLLMRRWG